MAPMIGRPRLLGASGGDARALADLAPAFFTDACSVIKSPWGQAAVPDFVMPETEGERPPDLENQLRFGVGLARLAAKDPDVHKTSASSAMGLPRSFKSSGRAREGTSAGECTARDGTKGLNTPPSSSESERNSAHSGGGSRLSCRPTPRCQCREYTLSSTLFKRMIVYCSFHLQCGERKMKSYRELAMEFIETLKRENAEAQREIDRHARYQSDVMDQEIRLLRQDIESRFRTIIYLKEELRQLLCHKPRE